MDVSVIRDPLGGANQSGMRDHNERLVLSLILRHVALPSAEIARRSNLSAQTVSIIIRALERDGLLLRGEPQRGKVGKPSIPMTLDPDERPVIAALARNYNTENRDYLTLAYPAQTVASRIGDLDGDDVVGPADLAMLLASWGRCEACPEDLDGDGDVDAADLAMLLADWG